METPLVLLGATAVGKSALAMDLAESLDAEIVSADALQVYRGLDIGTAKPSAADRARVRHHLIDILDPSERYSAGEFARRAHQAVAAIADRGRRAIVVGGSGLYLEAFVDGLAELPAVPAGVRRRMATRRRAEGLGALRAELEEVDPVTASRLEPGDSQRTQRALEIFHASGRPLSEWLARSGRVEGNPAIQIGLTVSRGLLYDRIAARVHRMVAQGWVEEVRGLLRAGVERDAPAFQAIGYRQLAGVVAGEIELSAAVAEIIRETRRFAKRQLTWFRRRSEIRWVDAEDPEVLAEGVLHLLRPEHTGAVP